MNNLKLIRWLLSFVKPLRLLMIGAIFLGVLSNLAVVVIPVLGAITGYQIFSGATVHVTPILFVLIGCGILRGVTRYLEQYLNHNIAFRLLAIIREKIFAQLRLLGPAKLSGKKSGDLIATITTDVEALEVFFAHTISPVAIAFFTTIATVTFLGSYHWGLAAVLLGGQILVGIFLPIKSYQRHQAIGDNYQQAFVNLNQEILEDISSLSDINQYQLQEEKIKELRAKGDALNQQYQLRLKQGSSLRIFGELILIVTALIILILAAFLQLPPITVIVATVLSLSSFGSVLALNGLGNDLLLTLASGRRIYGLMQEIPSVTFGTEGATTVNKLRLTNLSFGYQSKQKIFEAINLSLNAGSWLGIGGESGSGKSTLVKLLMRYWNPDTGTIALNQKELHQLSETTLHQLEGLMEQQTFIFETSILENIRLNNPDISIEAVQNAAKQAQIHEWINNLPEGYQTKIGGHARSVSDGERQRLGIARMLVFDAPLLLLDEPTSNLDYLNETSILKTLSTEIKNKTVILISHRPTTLAITDQQVELVDGKIIAK